MDKYKVVLIDNGKFSGDPLALEKDIFSHYPEIEFVSFDSKNQQEVIENAKDADAIMAVASYLQADVINALEKCRLIVKYGIGYDDVDLEAATRKGIIVCNNPYYCLKEVALHTVALIMALERKVVFYDKAVRQGKWFPYVGYEIHRPETQTLGFLGFGRIAREAARLLVPMGFNIIAFDPYVPDEFFVKHETRRVTFDELCSEADIISVNAMLSNETYHLISAEAIDKMKNTARIVNTARGAIIDTDALVKALKEGRVLAAALDAVENEPPVTGDYRILESDLMKLDNVIITPHAAFMSAEATADMHIGAAEAVVRIMVKKELPEDIIVNKKVLG